MEARDGVPGAARFGRADGMISTELADGELVVLSLEDGMYYGLNAVGARVWTLLEQPRTVRELQESLLAEFQVDRDRCNRELGDLLTDLVGLGMVRLHAEETTGVGKTGRPAAEGREPGSVQ